ncbi:MAG TPA: globin domain-containing protein [Flavisolibacter sp.]|nr:globin domain-containing protein [Flavisolibacter sp.]
MTKEEIALIKRSWMQLRNIDLTIIGDVFYSKLFFDAPNLKALFHKPMTEQSEKLFGMLNLIVARLDQRELINNEIRKLALRHKNYWVKTIHYDLVGNAFLWTLAKAFGGDWNEDLSKAWLKCYTSLASQMIFVLEESAPIDRRKEIQ